MYYRVFHTGADDRGCIRCLCESILFVPLHEVGQAQGTIRSRVRQLKNSASRAVGSTFVAMFTGGIATFLLSSHENYELIFLAGPIDSMINALTIFWINLPALVRARKDSVDSSGKTNGIQKLRSKRSHETHRDLRCADTESAREHRKQSVNFL